MKMEMDHDRVPTELTPNLVTQVLESSDRLELLEQLFGALEDAERRLLISRTSKKTELLSLLHSLEEDDQWSFQ